MHVYQRVEAALWARKQPVDGALLVALHMVVVELAEEVISDVVVALALDVQRLLDEAGGFLRNAPAPKATRRNLQKRSAMSSVNQSPSSMGITLSSSARNDRLWNPLQVVLDGFALVGQNQPRPVHRIATKHAAPGIGDQLANGVGQQ